MAEYSDTNLITLFRPSGTQEQGRFALTKKVSGHVTVHFWALSDAKGKSAIHRIRGRHTADAHCDILVISELFDVAIERH